MVADELDLVPANADFIVTVNVNLLRRVAVGRFLTAAGRQLPGLGRLDEVCGFDPTGSIDDLVLALPQGTLPSRPGLELMVAATGKFASPRLADCAERVVRQRGGTPARTPVGTFLTIRDRARPEGGELALRTGGPVLLASGPSLRELIDVVEHRAPSAREEQLHGPLREAVGADGAIVATWILRPGWLDHFVSPEEAARSTLTSLRGAAFRVAVAPDLEARLLLACATSEGCHDVERTMQALLEDLDSAAHALLGLDLKRVEHHQGSRHVTFSLTIDQREAEGLIERLTDDVLPALLGGVPVLGSAQPPRAGVPWSGSPSH